MSLLLYQSHSLVLYISTTFALFFFFALVAYIFVFLPKELRSMRACVSGYKWKKKV